MNPDWPVSAGVDPEALRGTPVGYVLAPNAGAGLAERVRSAGAEVVTPQSLPAGITLLDGVWPGIRMARDGDASAGPTGAPWVDSNGWLIRLALARNPPARVWVHAEPPKPDRVPAHNAHVLALADAAAHGGRWVSTALNDSVVRAMRFFDEHAEWAAWQPYAVFGILSDFAGGNEFLGQELLNLTARLNQPYRILIKSRADAASLAGLKAVLYADAEPPSPALRRVLSDFASAGGLLITGPAWGPAHGGEHPRFHVMPLGKGRVAVAKAPADDPYVLASDAQVLLSHRHDLVRFWNGGSVGSFLAAAPDRRRAVLHIVSYARRAERDPVSVRIAGPWRRAKLWDFSGGREISSKPDAGGLEIHLPPLWVYAAIEVS